MTADAAGGVWTYALDLSRALAARTIDVTLAVMGPSPSPAQRAEARGIDLRVGDYKLEWMEDPWLDVDRAGDWLTSLEQEIAPDIFHLNGYCHATLTTRAPKLVVAHSCVLSWWEAVHGEPAPASWNEYRKRVAAGIAAADFVVGPTRAMLASIERNYGPLGPSAVIPNGRDAQIFAPAAKEPFILTAGRFWDRAKNLDSLDRAARSLDWPVYAAGEGGSATEIRALGRLSAQDLRAWLARASIYALPARYEPFGLSILEAALCGCALVIGDIPSLRETWDGAAMFVPPDDSEFLADQLQYLIRSPEPRERLQREARMRAEWFTVDRMAGAYQSCYSALRCLSHPAAVFNS